MAKLVETKLIEMIRQYAELYPIEVAARKLRMKVGDIVRLATRYGIVFGK